MIETVIKVSKATLVLKPKGKPRRDKERPGFQSYASSETVRFFRPLDIKGESETGI